MICTATGGRWLERAVFARATCREPAPATRRRAIIIAVQPLRVAGVDRAEEEVGAVPLPCVARGSELSLRIGQPQVAVAAGARELEGAFRVQADAGSRAVHDLKCLVLVERQAHDRIVGVERVERAVRIDGVGLGFVVVDLGGAVLRCAFVGRASLFHRSAQHKPIALCVSHAETIAEHITKLVGGVRVEMLSSPDALAVARTLVPAVALLLGVGARRLLERRAMGGMLLRTLDVPGGVTIELTAPGWDADDVTFCVRHAAPLLTHEPSLTVFAVGGGIGLKAELVHVANHHE